MPSYYVPLNHLSEDQAPFSVYDSPLSEFSVLGFDYGYSLAQPNMLVMWEAQFGDFCNGGQVIIDNFIVAGETKWNRASGLVMLLPHGYEGQGPEHSSGHMARFLQLCAEDNIQVCNATLPAQYFHLLRRQLLRNFRKPLIVMTPKSLLRHPAAVSTLGELTTGTFREVLPDPEASKKPGRILLCSGKVYYDLRARQEKEKRDDVAIIRMEQLYPFPEEQLQSVLSRYGNPEELVWVQEEPRNRGGWTFMREQVSRSLPNVRLRYVGRPAAASPATGSHKRHQREQNAIVENAFSAELVDGYRLEQEQVTSVAT
jgi:2-oxoglutarate dehydrogenase E1 component